jgi:hypothetical protein
MKLVFPYHVKYSRTDNWYNGDWKELSDWCSLSIGKCAKDWEYMNECFLFTKEQDKLMFIMRWS